LATKFHGDLVVAKTTAPADDDLADGECYLWFDASTEVAKLRLKARDAAGTLLYGSVALSMTPP
ncbi:MAG: hypothetical protein U0746_22490, partial [Gemmataceae bacterium]